MSKLNLLGISGSLRKGAHSAAILKSLADAVTDKVNVEIFPLNDIPLYNEDLDTDDARPAPVNDFKSKIDAADGMIIISPEYNYGITGVLKNALDWASRPGYQSVLKDKPVLIIGSSIAATGGVRALDQVKQTLSGTLSRVTPVPEILVFSAQNKIENGRVIDAKTMEYLTRGVDALIADAHMCKSRA